MATTRDTREAQDFLREHYARLTSDDRAIREAGPPDDLHFHLLAWDAQRLAALAYALGHGRPEVRGWLGESAASARGALERHTRLTGAQAMCYLAVAGVTGDEALLALMRPERVRVAPGADPAHALDQVCAEAFMLAAAGQVDEAADRLQAGRGLVNGSGRSLDARLLAAVVAGDGHAAARVVEVRDTLREGRRARRDVVLTLDVVGLGILALARRQGVEVGAQSPALPLDLIAEVPVAPPARSGPARLVLEPDPDGIAAGTGRRPFMAALRAFLRPAPAEAAATERLV